MCIIKVDYVNQHEVQQQRLVEYLPSNAKQFDYINIIFFFNIAWKPKLITPISQSS